MSRPAQVLFWFAVWTVAGLFFSTQLVLINAHIYGRSIPLTTALASTLTEWYLWLPATPAMLWLSRTVLFERRRWMRAILLHTGAGVSIGLLQVLAFTWIAHTFGWNLGKAASFGQIFDFLFTVKFHWAILTYAVVIAATQAAAYSRLLEQREATLAKAELQALRSQLHPHFLFNSLQAALTLVRKDPPAAERMIVRIGDLLRMTLDRAGEHSVALREEIHFLELYLEIERTRFADRLTVQLEVEPQTLDLKVPHMILQPFVENAVKHGIAPRAAPGHIRVSAARRNGRLHLEVSDNGAGLASGAVKEGIGISNTRARLRQIYGERHTLELLAPSGGGFAARLEIPVP
ncbi:MAG: histidine kinase [Bryobacterales bacterium]|nr:histidine kinase [Bryobacterales bacterium]